MSVSPLTRASSYNSYYRPLTSTTDSITGVTTGTSGSGFVATAANSSSGTSAGGSLAGSVTNSVTVTPPNNLFDDRYFAPSAYLLSFPNSGMDPTQPIYMPSNQAINSYYNPQPLQITTSTTASVSDPLVTSQTGTGGTAASVYQEGSAGKTVTVYNPNTNATTTIGQTAQYAGTVAGTSPESGVTGIEQTVSSMSNVVTSLNSLAQSFSSPSGSLPAGSSASAATSVPGMSGGANGTASVAADGTLTLDAT